MDWFLYDSDIHHERVKLENFRFPPLGKNNLLLANDYRCKPLFPLSSFKDIAILSLQ